MTNLSTFDPDGLALAGSNIFGLPFTVESAHVVIVPVPWEVTVSYNAGTADGPEAILEASRQVDLFDPDCPDGWKRGIAMAELDPDLRSANDYFREKAAEYISFLEEGGNAKDPQAQWTVDEINGACERMNQYVQAQVKKYLDKGKAVGLVGGDHSTPLGFMRELGQRYSDFGVLHFDAHADLRDSFENFKYSHASIMFNALEIRSLSKLVQVGIRDYCSSENDLIKSSGGRVVAYFDRDIKARMYGGETWKAICQEALDRLPKDVYVSFDIDGLDPKLCPNTGTPVAGGLEYEQAIYMVKALVESGRRIIGFDINEVAPGDDEWDANVAARLLFRLTNLALLSNKK